MASMLLFSLLGIGTLLAAGSVIATALLYGSDWEALAREMRGHNAMHYAPIGSRPMPGYRETVSAFGGAGTVFRAIPVSVRPRHERRAAA